MSNVDEEQIKKVLDEQEKEILVDWSVTESRSERGKLKVVSDAWKSEYPNGIRFSRMLEWHPFQIFNYDLQRFDQIKFKLLKKSFLQQKHELDAMKATMLSDSASDDLPSLRV